MENKQLIAAATNSLQHDASHRVIHNRILFPEDATVEFPEFNPCHASQIIAIVSIPAMVNMEDRILRHAIYDGDAI